MRKNLAIAFIMTAICTISNAQAAPQNPPLKGGSCYGTPQALTCDYLGKVTVKEIYEKGWRVVSYTKEGPNTISLVIEEQR